MGHFHGGGSCVLSLHRIEISSKVSEERSPVLSFKTSKHMYVPTRFHTQKISLEVNAKYSRYSAGVTQRVGRGIALLFHDCGTRRGWVVSSTPRPHFTPGKDPVHILQEAWWASGPVWMGGKSCIYRDSIPNRPARSSVAISMPGPLSLDDIM